MARDKAISSRTWPEPVQSEEPNDPASGGQSGDLQGLSDIAGADSESVRELIEEGQSFEAGIISGIENAPDADEGGIRTREVLEDDVPFEYDKDADEPKD